MVTLASWPPDRPGEAIAALARAIDSGATRLGLVPADAWVPEHTQRTLAALGEDLDARVALWGLCGAIGRMPDGRSILRCLKDVPATGLDRTGGPRPVLGLGDSLLLVNVRALREGAVPIPALPGPGWAAALSAECLRRGRLPLVDDRLFCLHPGRHVPDPAVPGAAALVPYFDGVLARARAGRRPTLVVACRTQLDRPALLARAVRSFATAARQADALVATRVVLVSDVSREGLRTATEQLAPAAAGIALTAAHFEVRSKPLSRIDLLLAAARHVESEYLWFVDDDDFLQPGAVAAVARVLRPGTAQLVVGHSRVFHERWQPGSAASRPEASMPGAVYPADRVFWALGGHNYTPLCSLVFSTDALRERVAGVAADGEYCEDYFLLLRMLTGGATTVDTIDAEVAGVSVRGTENTIAHPGRAAWLESQAAFVGEALSGDGPNDPLLWRLTAELMRARQALGEVPDSPKWRARRPARVLKRLLGRRS